MIAALVLAALLQQEPASASTQPPTDPRDQTLCRLEPESGSRITTNVCMSLRDWDTRREAMEDQRARVRPVIDNRRMNSRPGSGRRS